MGSVTNGIRYVGGLNMIVTCAICGHVATVDPKISPINGKYMKKVYSNPPKVWICDTHVTTSFMIIGNK